MSALATVRSGLAGVAETLPARGLPRVPLRGKLLRPLLAWAMAPQDDEQLDERFWSGALALQMVHEASLLHDDILDGADSRRGEATVAAVRGVGAALVQGDHLLTAAYRVAVGARSPAFIDRFVRAVERTVAGEMRQGRASGRRLGREESREIIEGKSGELFGCAASLGWALAGRPIGDAYRFGLRLGCLYQMVDDYLDLCSAAGTGKPPLQDYLQGKWTWVMSETGLPGFRMNPAELEAWLFEPHDGVTEMRRALVILEGEASALSRRARLLSPKPAHVEAIVEAWIDAARNGLEASEREHARAAVPMVRTG